MSVLKPVYNIYQLKMYPILNILTFGCRFPCRADNAAYPHDGRADKRRYRHDRRADSQCQSGLRHTKDVKNGTNDNDNDNGLIPIKGPRRAKKIKGDHSPYNDYI